MEEALENSRVYLPLLTAGPRLLALRHCVEARVENALVGRGVVLRVRRAELDRTVRRVEKAIVEGGSFN